MNNNESNSNEGYEWPIVVRNSSRHSNLDYYYGPYDSYEDMDANVPSTVRDFGFTAAVHNADGSVTEYWLIGTSKSNLKWQQKNVQFNEAISVKGSVSSLEELEAKTDNKVGDMYLIKNEDGTYAEYIWVEDSDGNGHWELLGTETVMMKGTLSFKGVTPTTDEGNACEGYNGSQNVTVDMSGFASRSALSTATSGLSNLIESEIIDVKKSVSCRNYALKTYASMTKSHSDSSVQGTYYYYKGIAGNTASLKGTTVTVSFDYEATINDGSFNFLVMTTYQTLKQVTESESGHFTKTFTLSKDVTNCEKYSWVYIQGFFVGSCTISNFKWELGDTETEWCPAPEDFKDVITISDGGQLESSKLDIPQIGYSIKNTRESQEVYRDIHIGLNQMKVSYCTTDNTPGGVTFYLDNDTSKSDSERNSIDMSTDAGYATFQCNGFGSLLNPLIYYARLKYKPDSTDDTDMADIKNEWNPYGLVYLGTHINLFRTVNTNSDLYKEDNSITYPANSYQISLDMSKSPLRNSRLFKKITMHGNSRYQSDNGDLKQSYISYIDHFIVSDKLNIVFISADDATLNEFYEADIYIYAFGENI